MFYLNCPRCGLGLTVRDARPPGEICPRCLGRGGDAVPMYRTPGPRPPVAASRPETALGADAAPRGPRAPQPV